MSYEVLSITSHDEMVLVSHSSMERAFDECVDMWRARKAGSPVYAVRDTDTEQRWSYADIRDLRQPLKPEGKQP